MSLINDALKRARQGQQQNPFGGQPTVPLQPVDYAARPNYSLRFALAVLLVAALALSGWFFWKWWRSSGESHRTAGVIDESTTASTEKSKTSAKPVQRKQPIKVSTNIVVRTNSVAPPQSEALAQAVSINAPSSAPQTNAAALAPPPNVAAPAPPSPFADLKLQSIIFSETKPLAGINGELLYVGDEIRGARVTKIERQSVTVERNGETNVLRLPRL
ncbi:MAG: hypothetical protein DME22_15190 [Verrucomicrobia bacterium]|nr:MAG: hypothetical protein DME22_15190 [Verrucomicrobiota bacterium]PYK00112.1 MAG: hypothetical protein DME23_08170 [Verrucomicrobiota bacterium]